MGTSQKSVRGSVSCKERISRSLRVYHAKSVIDSSWEKIYNYFFADEPLFFCEKIRMFSTKIAKSRFSPQKSREITEIRRFSAIFGVFPRKKRQRHEKSVVESVWKSVTPRKERPRSVTWKERNFGNNYVAQKMRRRSSVRSFEKLRYFVYGN